MINTQILKVELKSPNLTRDRTLYCFRKTEESPWQWKRYDNEDCITQEFKEDYLVDRYEIERLLSEQNIKIIENVDDLE